jgi:hypothetical protein
VDAGLSLLYSPSVHSMSKPPELPNNNEFLRWLETVDDPAERFALASKVLAQQSEAGSRLAAIRAAAAAATYEGSSYGQVAARLGISRSRAQQLVNEGRGGPAKAPAASMKDVSPKRAATSKRAGVSKKAAVSKKSVMTKGAGSKEAVRVTRERSSRTREKEN